MPSGDDYAVGRRTSDVAIAQLQLKVEQVVQNQREFQRENRDALVTIKTLVERQNGRVRKLEERDHVTEALEAERERARKYHADVVHRGQTTRLTFAVIVATLLGGGVADLLNHFLG